MIPGNLASLMANAVTPAVEIVYQMSTSDTTYTNTALNAWLAANVTEGCRVRIKVDSGVLVHAVANQSTFYLPLKVNNMTIDRWILDVDGYVLGGGGTPSWDASGKPGQPAFLVEGGVTVDVTGSGIIAGGGGAGGTDDAARGKWGGGGAPNGGYGATTWHGGPAYQAGGMAGEGGAPGFAGHASYVNGSRTGGAAGKGVKAVSGTFALYSNGALVNAATSAWSSAYVAPS